MSELTIYLQDHGLLGLVIGACTFLIIGLFHPIVIKAEYYLGTGCWWGFLLLGVAAGAVSFTVSDTLLSTVAGVVGFSALWSIKEVFEQEQRVARGWFPANPRRQKTPGSTNRR
ncbi:MAG: DUF4491 family protein [Muribaculaceae bacterium]|nr:DUF4491 family protein [Muribaculaceae bacterium]